MHRLHELVKTSLELRLRKGFRAEAQGPAGELELVDGFGLAFLFFADSLVLGGIFVAALERAEELFEARIITRTSS